MDQSEIKARIVAFVIFGFILWGTFILFEKAPLLAAAVGALIIAYIVNIPTKKEQEITSIELPKPTFLFSEISETRDGL